MGTIQYAEDEDTKSKSVRISLINFDFNFADV